MPFILRVYSLSSSGKKYYIIKNYIQNLNFLFVFGHTAQQTINSPTGTEPRLLAVRAQSPNH